MSLVLSDSLPHPSTPCVPQESSEHYNRMLSEYTREIQELKRQLVDRQQQLNAAEKHSSATTQHHDLDTAELKLLLVEKDSQIKVSCWKSSVLLDMNISAFILGFYYELSQSWNSKYTLFLALMLNMETLCSLGHGALLVVIPNVKDGGIVILQELVERGQNTDGSLAEPRIKEESDHVLELKHTVQILKSRLIEREGNTSKSHKDSRFVSGGVFLFTSHILFGLFLIHILLWSCS